MKEFFKSLFASKTKLAILVIVLAVVGYLSYKHFHTTSASVSYVLGQASKQTIITSVSGTGQVSQDRTVNITPGSSGKLTAVYVKQGQTVKAGQTIAVVDETNNAVALSQAKASLASAQASYDAVMAGSTTQDLQLSQLSVDSAQQALDQANANLDTVTKQQAQAVASAQTALMNSGLVATPLSSNVGVGTVTVSGSYSGTDQGSYTIQVFNTGANQQFNYSGLESGIGTASKLSPQALGTKGLYIQFNGTLYNDDTWTINIPNKTSASYNTNVTAYQNALTNQTTAIANAQNQIVTAQNNVKQALINQQVKQQPPTDQQIASAKAQLLSAQAQVANADAAYNNNILKAPFDGTLAQLNNQVGDEVTASTNVAVAVTNQSIAIIPLNEVDVASIKLGDKASMTFNAVDGLIITGTVVQIDDIGTVSQGVVSYNVKIAFDTEDDRVKPGMSVNVSVITNIAADVLSVPSSAILTQGTNSFVQKLDPSQTQTVAGQTGVSAKTPPTRTAVQIGLSDGTNTQITGGLSEGDSIVVQTITVSSTKSAASSATSALRLGGGAFGGGGNTTFTRPAGGGGETTRPGG